MKKLAIVLLGGFVGFGAFADILDPSVIQRGGSSGSHCYRRPDGTVVCNYVDTGGGYEQKLCVRECETGSDVACTCDTNTEDAEVHTVGDKQFCWKKVKTDCTQGKPGAASAFCVNNPVGGGNVQRSCAAYTCQPNFLLYTTNRRSEIAVVGTNKKVGSQGLCRAKSYLENVCRQGCGCDENTEECVLNEVTVRNYGNNVKAFIGEEMCICQRKSGGVVIPPVPHQQSCEEQYPNDPEAIACCKSKRAERWDSVGRTCICKDPTETWDPDLKDCKKRTEPVDEAKICYYDFDGNITCNGRSIHVTKHELLSAEEVARLGIEDCRGLDPAVIRERVQRDRNLMNSLQEKWCREAPHITPVQDDNTDALNAMTSLNTFFRNTESSANVWKNKDGNFNTARLASDATAGVVLGTVGGIVSAKIIKKKQLEKGYDALNCAIGGQKVANWGDIFTVGRR